MTNSKTPQNSHQNKEINTSHINPHTEKFDLIWDAIVHFYGRSDQETSDSTIEGSSKSNHKSTEFHIQAPTHNSPALPSPKTPDGLGPQICRLEDLGLPHATRSRSLQNPVTSIEDSPQFKGKLKLASIDQEALQGPPTKNLHGSTTQPQLENSDYKRGGLRIKRDHGSGPESEVRQLSLQKKPLERV